MVPPLDSCCCVCSLRRGSLIIGCLNVVTGLLHILLMTLKVKLPTIFKDVKMAVSLFAFIYLAVLLVMALILIVLVSKDKKKELKWWVYVTTVLAFGHFVHDLLMVGFIFAHFSSAFFFVNMYFMLVVYSFAVENDSSPAHQHVV